MSRKSVQQECLTRVFQRECLTRVCHKIVEQECQARVAYNAVKHLLFALHCPVGTFFYVSFEKMHSGPWILSGFSSQF